MCVFTRLGELATAVLQQSLQTKPGIILADQLDSSRRPQEALAGGTGFVGGSLGKDGK